MIDLAFSPITSHHTMASSGNGVISSKFEHAQIMSHNLQSLLFQGSPVRSGSGDSGSNGNVNSFHDSSPSIIGGKNRIRRNSGLFPVPDLKSNTPINLHTSTSDIASSPTTSALAADMCQNFHIDKTPVLPTPRRSLFQFPKSNNTNRSFGGAALRRAATTTSILTTIPSSPLMRMEMETDNDDSSPLPHKSVNITNEMKPPSSSISQITSTSSFALNPSTFPSTSSNSVKPKPFAMARMKSLSNASFLLNSRPQLTPIQQEFTINKGSTTPIITDSPDPDGSINSLFAPSPVAQRVNREKCKSALYISRPAPPTRDSFGAPRPGLTRHSKVRRTHSMFQHPEEFLSEELNEEKEVIDSSPTIINDDCQSILTQENCSIKTFTVKEDPFRRIERESLCEILDGKHNHTYDRFLIIDCRFEYEYEGGHIDGAININSKDCLEEVLLTDVNANSKPNEKLLLIFHCEYSAHRGPRMAMHLRNCDRHLNMRNYPRLHYPDIVILQGGYSHFFEQNFDRCFPQRYVGMNDASHAKTCEREMDKFRKNMKFSRAQTFTFGSSVSGNGNSFSSKTMSIHTDIGTPCAGGNTTGKPIEAMLSDFRFPLQERDTNTTPTGPPSRKLAGKLSSLNDYMDSSTTTQSPQFNVCAQLRFA